jgi:hypothetical protein
MHKKIMTRKTKLLLTMFRLRENKAGLDQFHDCASKILFSGLKMFWRLFGNEKNDIGLRFSNV